MKVSVIAAVYKDIEALDMIVQALKEQTYRDYELVVAEDCHEETMKSYVETIVGLGLQHKSQEDKRVQNTQSSHNAVTQSPGQSEIVHDGAGIP